MLWRLLGGQRSLEDGRLVSLLAVWRDVGSLSASNGQLVVDSVPDLGRGSELTSSLGLQLLQLHLLFNG